MLLGGSKLECGLFVAPFSATADAAGAALPAVQQSLSDAMIRYWTAFVATGKPRVAGLPDWPPFRAPTDVRQLASGTGGIRNGVDVDAEHHCSTFWRSVNGWSEQLKELKVV